MYLASWPPHLDALYQCRCRGPWHASVTTRRLDDTAVYTRTCRLVRATRRADDLSETDSTVASWAHSSTVQ